MKIKDEIQAKYNKGEINFKELNKLYKKYENVLDVEKEDYDKLAKYFDDTIKMNDILQSIYNSMFIKVSNPIDPKYIEKKKPKKKEPEAKPIKPVFKDSCTSRRDEEIFNKLMFPIYNPPSFEWTGEPKPIYDDNKTIIFRTKGE